MLTRTPHRSLTEQLAERFAERIRARLLPVGARLPSVRDCARQQDVSPYTVVAAYDQLLAQGLVEARRQRGGQGGVGPGRETHRRGQHQKCGEFLPSHGVYFKVLSITVPIQMIGQLSNLYWCLNWHRLPARYRPCSPEPLPNR